MGRQHGDDGDVKQLEEDEDHHQSHEGHREEPGEEGEEEVELEALALHGMPVTGSKKVSADSRGMRKHITESTRSSGSRKASRKLSQKLQASLVESAETDNAYHATLAAASARRRQDIANQEDGGAGDDDDDDGAGIDTKPEKPPRKGLFSDSMRELADLRSSINTSKKNSAPRKSESGRDSRRDSHAPNFMRSNDKDSVSKTWRNFMIILTLISLGTLGAAVALYINEDWRDLEWASSSALWRLIALITCATGTLPAAHFFTVVCFRHCLFPLLHDDTAYWLTGMQPSVIGVLWSVSTWVAITLLIPIIVDRGGGATAAAATCANSTDLGFPSAANDEGLFVLWTSLIFTSIIVVSALRVLKVLVSKHLATQVHKGAFWDSVREALLLENMLAVLGVAGYQDILKEEEGITVLKSGDKGTTASFWKSVDRVLQRPVVNVIGKWGVPTYKMRSTVPSFAEQEAFEQQINEDADTAARLIFKKCGAIVPPEPDPNDPDAVPNVLNQDYLLSFDMFVSAFKKEKRRLALPKSDAKFYRLLENWWNHLDDTMHGGPFYALTIDSANVPSDRIPHLRTPYPQTEHTIMFPELCSTLRTLLTRRESLYNTLHDREDIASIMSRTLDVVFWAAMCFVVPIIMGINVTQLLLPLGTFVLGLAFVFGNSLREAWECILFLFGTRPFAVGDRVQGISVGYNEYPNMFVRKIGLLQVEMQITDGRWLLVPTITLKTTNILQHARARDYACSASIMIGIQHGQKIITEIAKRLKDWAIKDRADRGAPWDTKGYLFWVSAADQTIGQQTTNVWLPLRGITWASPGMYLPLRSDLVIAWMRICRDLGVGYQQPVQEIRLLEHPLVPAREKNGIPEPVDRSKSKSKGTGKRRSIELASSDSD